MDIFKIPIAPTEGGMLSKLWRNIVVDLNMSKRLTSVLINYNEAGDDAKAKKKTRSTMKSNMCAGEMTWKVFIDIMFGLLNVKRISINMELTGWNNEKSTHIMIAVNNRNVRKKEILKKKTSKVKGSKR